MFTDYKKLLTNLFDIIIRKKKIREYQHYMRRDKQLWYDSETEKEIDIEEISEVDRIDMKGR